MPHPGEQYGSCPRCGARTERFQEHCLDCGGRLPRTPAPSRLPLGDRLGPAVALLGLTIVATAASVAAAPSSSGTPTLTATLPVTVGPGTGTAAATTSAPAPTLTTGTLPTAPGETATAPATAPTPPPTVAGGLVVWPAGHGGYTDVLASIPVSAGRAAAESEARGAARSGLPQVGVLASSGWSSLRGGYYVVFSGIYSSADAAASALAGAHASGYADAYSARVSP